MLVEVREIYIPEWMDFFTGWVVAALELEMVLAIWRPAVTS